jgi:Tfp pilus assembly protein PilZ
MSKFEHFRSSPRPQVNHQVTLARKNRPKDSPIVAFTRDISTGGIFIETEQDFEIGEKLTVVLQSPTTWQPLTLNAEVCRIDAGSERKKRGVGLHFVDMSDTELVALIELTTSLDFEG